MAQYTLGTVQVTNASNAVTVTGASSGADAVAVGQQFKVARDGEAIYQIASRTPASGGSLTSLTLTVVYGGTSGSGLGYQIARDYSANRSYVLPAQGDGALADWLTRSLTQIDADLGSILGTGSWPNFNTGSVLFKGGAGVGITQDNANFFWDATNKRLGIGLSAPNAPLGFANTTGTKIHLYDDIAAARFGFGINANEVQLFFPTAGHFSINNGGDLQTSGTNEIMRIFYSSGPKVGIGLTAPNAPLGFAPNAGTKLHLYDDVAAARFGFGINASELQCFIPAAAHFSINSGGDLQASGTNEILRVLPGPLVGIGTSSPNAPLGFATTAGTKIHLSDGAATARYGVGINTNEVQLFFPAAGHFSINSGGDLQASGTNEILRVLPGPLVGIGLTAPNAPLGFAAATGTKIHLYDSIATARYGLGINANEVQLFLPTAGHFSINNGGDLQASGTNEIMRIFYSSGPKVGIGLTAPNAPLGFAPNAGTKLHLYDDVPANRYGFGINASELQCFVPTGSHLSINGGGDLQASGTNEIARFLWSAGNGFLGLMGVPTHQLHLFADDAVKPSTTTWTVSSDARLKRNIVPADLDRCIAIVKAVPLKRWTWKSGLYSTKNVPDQRKIGWVADDVLAVFPHAITVGPVTIPPGPDGTGGETITDCLSLNADQMQAATYGAVQRLIQRVEALEAAHPS